MKRNIMLYTSQQEALAQIVDSPVIASRLSTNLQKFAGLMAIAVTMIGMMPEAHAGGKTANKIAAVLAAGAGIGYMGGNTDAARAMGAGAAGALLGGQIGNGSGSTAASILGAGLAYGYVNNSLQQEKLRQQQQMYNNGGYNNGYNNGNYNNGGYNNGGYNSGFSNNGGYRPAGYGYAAQPAGPVYNAGYPQNNQHYQQNTYQNAPQYQRQASNAPQNQQVLYQVQGNSNFFVTVDTSPAMRQMRGETSANRALNDDLLVSRELNTSYNNYMNSYRQLQQAYQNYETLAYNSNIDGQRVKRQMMYSSDPNGVVAVTNDNTRIRSLQSARQNLEEASQTYGVYKGTFFTNADNAAFEGFDVRSYAAAMDYVNPPEQIKVALNGSNKFPIVRDDRVGFSLR